MVLGVAFPRSTQPGDFILLFSSLIGAKPTTQRRSSSGEILVKWDVGLRKILLGLERSSTELCLTARCMRTRRLHSGQSQSNLFSASCLVRLGCAPRGMLGFGETSVSRDQHLVKQMMEDHKSGQNLGGQQTAPQGRIRRNDPLFDATSASRGLALTAGSVAQQTTSLLVAHVYTVTVDNYVICCTREYRNALMIKKTTRYHEHTGSDKTRKVDSYPKIIFGMFSQRLHVFRPFQGLQTTPQQPQDKMQRNTAPGMRLLALWG